MKGAERWPAPQTPYLQRQGHPELAQVDNPPHSPLAPSHFLRCHEGQQDLRREELLALGNGGGSWSGGSAKHPAGLRQRAAKASPGQEEGLERGPAAPPPRGPLPTVGDLLRSGRQPDPQPPLSPSTRCPKNSRVSLLQEDGNLQGGLCQGGRATAPGEARRGELQGWAPLAPWPRPSRPPACCHLERRA